MPNVRRNSRGVRKRCGQWSVVSCQWRECSKGRAGKRCGGAGLAIAFLAAGIGVLAAAGPIDVTQDKELFLDDHLIASTTRVQRQVRPARKFAGNPVIWPEETSG